MKKFIIFVIVLLALLSIDHPVLNKYRSKLLGDSINFLSEKSKVNRSPVTSLTKTLIDKELTLSESEREYVNDTFTSEESIRFFQLRYCKEHDYNLYFYEQRLTKVCNAISDALAVKRG